MGGADVCACACQCGRAWLGWCAYAGEKQLGVCIPQAHKTVVRWERVPCVHVLGMKFQMNVCSSLSPHPPHPHPNLKPFNQPDEPPGRGGAGVAVGRPQAEGEQGGAAAAPGVGQEKQEGEVLKGRVYVHDERGGKGGGGRGWGQSSTQQRGKKQLKSGKWRWCCSILVCLCFC